MIAATCGPCWAIPSMMSRPSPPAPPGTSRPEAPVFPAPPAQWAGPFKEITAILDPKAGVAKAEKPEFIKTGDVARVKIRPTKPMVIEAYKQFPQMGRFAIRDMGQTVAAGQVIDVEKR